MSQILTDLTKLAKLISENQNLDLEEKEDEINFVLENLERFPKYFNSVIMTETRIKMLQFLYEREDYIDKVQGFDQNRRDAHILATQAINKINRLAIRYGMEPIFKFDGCNNRELVSSPIVAGVRFYEDQAKNDRKIAADLVYDFCKTVFLKAIEREKYGAKDATREERDDELYQMGKDGVSFDDGLTLEELFEAARSNAEDGEIIENINLENSHEEI